MIVFSFFKAFLDLTEAALSNEGHRCFRFDGDVPHDQNTAAWGETGAGGAAKQLKADATTTFASAAAVADAAGEVLDFYNESYGSLANFSVMCPGDATWQRTVAGLVGDVVATGSAGVYIDQASEASRQSKN